MEKPLHDFLMNLYELRPEEELALWLLEELPSLIPGENAIVGLHNPQAKEAVQLRLKHPFTTPNFVEALNESGAAKDHPIWAAVPGQPYATKALSTMMGDLDWREHPLYRDYLLKDEVRDHLTLDIDRGHGHKVMIGILRSRRGFRDKESRLLSLLGPHLEQAFANAALFQVKKDLQEADAGHRLVHHGKTGSELQAQFLLHFPRWESLTGSRLEALRMKGRAWVQGEVDALLRGCLEQQLTGFVMSGPCADIHLRLRRNWGAQGFILIEQVQRTATHPFTPRESEVYSWVVEGKSDGEIAMILGIGLHTVKGHVKQLLRKRGVRSRVELAAMSKM
ncbi:MAG: hypothetical protein JJU29_00405 [Verrucomicrobia bacterium]|nr:hypothetical protein [Verrucomicrobiota bacterium]MCH8510375.1 LuxR C-terminal-related transcriptional regulator [Kiritimatiellia bacterium]